MPIENSTQPKSILKNKNKNENKITASTNNNVVIFQHEVDIPDLILPTWRRARSSLANAAKASLRAAHYGTLRSSNLPPLWAVGIGKLPNFLPLDPGAKTALIAAKRHFAMDCLGIVRDCLDRKATQEQIIGTTFRTTVTELYGNPTTAEPALDLLETLVNKERAATNSVLNTRLVALQNCPVTPDQIISTMIVETVAPRTYTTTPNPAPNPTPNFSRGRGGRGGQRRRTPSPAARGRGTRRGGRGSSRGGPRGDRGGRGASGTPQDRSRSPNHRLTVQANNRVILTARELVIIEALRGNVNQ